jgi:hypothetical protein
LPRGGIDLEPVPIEAGNDVEMRVEDLLAGRCAIGEKRLTPSARTAPLVLRARANLRPTANRWFAVASGKSCETSTCWFGMISRCPG